MKDDGTRLVYCTNGHAVWFWGSHLRAKPGMVYLWGTPLLCGKCNAHCMAR